VAAILKTDQMIRDVYESVRTTHNDFMTNLFEAFFEEPD